MVPNHQPDIYKVVPPSYKLVYNPHEYYRYNPLINPTVIGLIGTNLANELGHHLVYIYIYGIFM